MNGNLFMYIISVSVLDFLCYVNAMLPPLLILHCFPTFVDGNLPKSSKGKKSETTDLSMFDKMNQHTMKKKIKKIEKPMATKLSILDKSAPSITLFNNCLDNVVEFCLYFSGIILDTFLYTAGYQSKDQLLLLVSWI